MVLEKLETQASNYRVWSFVSTEQTPFKESDYDKLNGIHKSAAIITNMNSMFGSSSSS
jgi:hypothetical protein